MDVSVEVSSLTPVMKGQPRGVALVMPEVSWDCCNPPRARVKDRQALITDGYAG